MEVENEVEGSVLGHLKEFFVKVGDQVDEGQQLGLSDNTGNSTGPHLHWGYYIIPRNRDNGFNGYIDQTDWINIKSLVITDQTVLPIIDPNGNKMEVQAVRSKLADQERQITNQIMSLDALNAKIGQLEDKLTTCTAQLQTPPQSGSSEPTFKNSFSRFLYSIAKNLG
jgi:septal ring factor EnvC (AmiA/AmiB activator)